MNFSPDLKELARTHGMDLESEAPEAAARFSAMDNTQLKTALRNARSAIFAASNQTKWNVAPADQLRNFVGTALILEECNKRAEIGRP